MFPNPKNPYNGSLFIEARKNRLSMFLEGKDENGLSKLNPEYEKYQTHKIGGYMALIGQLQHCNLFIKTAMKK